MYTSSLPVWLACFIVLMPLASAQTEKGQDFNGRFEG